LFVGLDEARGFQKKGGYTRRIAALTLDAAAPIKKREKQHAIIAHELQSEQSLSMVF
jgi:hypothetical protein